MNSQILSCCSRNSQFEIKYQTGDIFKVCSNCLKLPFWNKHIKEKKEL